jgi:hypothetical protein
VGRPHRPPPGAARRLAPGAPDPAAADLGPDLAASHGLRPAPFFLGIGVSVLGPTLSLLVPETAPATKPSALRWVRGVGVPSLVGAATNLKDGLVWLALPLTMTARGFDLVQVGAVAGLYPLVWAGGQIVFGPLSDRYGRPPPSAR